MISDINIDNLSHDGRGIARIDGKINFVFNALPGEKVSLKVLKSRSRFDESIALSVENAHENRVKPLCPHFGSCGGCSLQHLSHAAQIAHKEAVLFEQLKHFGGLLAKTKLAPIVGQGYGYRHKARYSAKNGEGLGFRALDDATRLLAIKSCPILSQKLEALIPPLQEVLSSFEQSANFYQIDAAESAHSVVLLFHGQHVLEHRKALSLFAQKHGLIIALQSEEQKSIHRLLPEGKLAPERISLSFWASSDIELFYSPGDFTQVNPAVNQLMIAQACTLLNLEADDVVLDFFCGMGNFSLAIAKQVRELVGIDGMPALIERAKENAKHNNIKNTRFYAGDLNSLEALKLIPQNTNKILIDPPRAGAKALLERLDLNTIERVVYVSCNPSTLARDAKILALKGFSLESAGIMDMFTHTEHVEAMASFLRE
jgi:23S rRNA (uracil1939-C5)-methyltransferase